MRLAWAERLAFVLTLALAASIMWLAERPPMTDLPQHAAQVALWRDLLLGQSAFSDIVRINLLTPYLIGYGLMLPLSLVFSMAVTAKIVLTLAYLCFVGACILLRRELGADRRLDWLFLVSFFGFCWKWGFLTFLVASPAGLLFLLLAIRHSSQPTRGRSVQMMLGGVLLLFAHGLLFLAFLFLAGLVMLERLWTARGSGLVWRLAPCLLLLGAGVAFRFATQGLDGAARLEGFEFGAPVWERPLAALVHVVDVRIDGANAFAIGLVGAMLAAPFLLGLKFNSRPAILLLAGLAVLLALVPADALQTSLLFHRFSLFLPPFVAMAFAAAPTGGETSGRSIAIVAMVMASTWFCLGLQARRVYAFGQESHPFETVLARALPGKRALAVIMDRNSDAVSQALAYMHYASWYQADKHGFVDFNFATFHPQVVRFRPDRVPLDATVGDCNPGYLNCTGKNLGPYAYIFLRGKAAEIEAMRSTSTCQLTLVAQDAPWALLERGECAGDVQNEAD